jgi:DNA-directed RNA polymerase subunit RPC12/RpoP
MDVHSRARVAVPRVLVVTPAERTRHAGAVCPRCRPSSTMGGNLGIVQRGGGWRCPSCGHRWMPVVLPSAPMAAPKNPRGGRKKRVPGEETKAYAVNLTVAERERYERLAQKWKCKLGVAMRRAMDEACERERV